MKGFHPGLHIIFLAVRREIVKQINKQFLNTAKIFKYLSKYRRKFCLEIGIQVYSPYKNLKILFNFLFSECAYLSLYK
jgi:hypothetical protein